MKLYYTGWTGRYFGIFLNHSNPLLFHSIIGFKVLPVLLIGATIFSFYSLFRHLTPTLSRIAHIGFAGVVFFLFVVKMAGTSEAFYWMAGFVTFTVPSILTLFWIVLVLRWYRQDTQSAKILVGFLAGFLVFASIGCSEPNLLTMVLLIGAWWVYRLLYHRKVDGFMVAMLAQWRFFHVICSLLHREMMPGSVPIHWVEIFLFQSFRHSKCWPSLVMTGCSEHRCYSFRWPGWSYCPEFPKVHAFTFRYPVWYALLVVIGILRRNFSPIIME
jgi:hypothetical protein